MVQMLLSVGLTDGIESSFGVGLTDGIYSVGSHWSVLHTFDERLRVGSVVCLSVLLCVGCTNGICVAILASRICVTIPFAPTHPPGAEGFGRTTVRDASAIPCRGTRGIRAERGVGTIPPRTVPGGTKLGRRFWAVVS